MLGKLLGAIGSWIGAALCAYGAGKIIEMILTGVASSNWLMVIAGGILAYLFGFILIIATIFLTVLGVVLLVD